MNNKQATNIERYQCYALESKNFKETPRNKTNLFFAFGK